MGSLFDVSESKIGRDRIDPRGLVAGASGGFDCWKLGSAVVCRERNPKQSRAYRCWATYSGTYSIDGNKVTHKIEVSWNQAWSGTNQPRFVEIKVNRLTIKTAPSICAMSGKESVRTLVGERIK